jgi:hypothetical protein
MFPTTVLIWNTKKPGKRIGVALNDMYLLNPNRIIELRVKGTGSKFFYANDPDDPRDSPDYIECTSTVDEIRTAYDTVPLSKFVDVPIFPTTNLSDNDITGTPVSTHIAWENIAYAWATPSDAEAHICHGVYYRNDWQRVIGVGNVDLAVTMTL